MQRMPRVRIQQQRRIAPAAIIRQPHAVLRVHRVDLPLHGALCEERLAKEVAKAVQRATEVLRRHIEDVARRGVARGGVALAAVAS